MGTLTTNLRSQTDSDEVARMAHKRMIFGQYDGEFSFPTMAGTPGQKDAAALNAVQLYLTASARGAWPGFDATGTMVVGAGEQKSELSAALTVQPGGLYRLDLTTPYGTRSERVDGTTGSMQSENGNVVKLPALSVASGLIPLPTTLSDATTDVRDSLIEGGIVSVDGAQLDKVTFIRPLFSVSRNAAPSGAPLISDFFFDPTSHLLKKSVDAVLLSPESTARHLRVITYDDYHTVSGTVIPFRFTETVDGRLVWSIQLATVIAGPNHDKEYFSF